MTKEFIVFNDKKLFRIKALIDFNGVKVGDLGGFVESEDNLSHDGTCWVFDNARVYDNAQVYGNAEVYDNDWIYDFDI